MAESLAAEIAKCNVTDDRVVSFDGRGLKLDNAQSAEDIVNAIETCPKMEILNLAGNTLGVEAAQEIANALQGRPTLKFALWKDMYTGRLRSEIPPSLRALSSSMIIAGTQLVELDLSDNAFGPDGAEAIRALLTSPVAYTIQALKFQNNGLGGGGVIIAECLKQNHERAKKAGKSLDLRTFIAGRNRLENPGAKALGEAFSLIGTLEQIEVIQNGIQCDGIKALAECIKHSPNLKILNLNDNIMTPKGAIAIANALPTAKKLEVLNIGDCLAKSEGAKAIAENIKGLVNLKELILSYNEIRSDGGEAVAAACAHLPSLTTLDLDGNHFGEDGKKLVSDALGTRTLVLKPGLNNDEGVPSDNEEEAEEKKEEEEKKDSPEKNKAAPAPFVFGKPAPKLVGSDEPSRPFGFGAGGGFSFSSVTGTNIFAKNEGETSFKGAGTALFSTPTATDNNPEKEADVQFEPLVHLTQVEVKKGDEDDNELYKHRAKLYRFDKDANMWKERGVGDIRILQNKDTKKARLLMRRDIILKICCNHFISKEMNMKPNAGSDKSLTWFAVDYADDEAKPEKLALRFKTAEICGEFLAAFLKAQQEMPEPGTTPVKEPKPAEPVKNEPFSFASLAANAEKAAFAKSPDKSAVKVNDTSYREVEEEPNVQFEPLVKLDKVEMASGTEGEEAKFTHRSKLYRFDKDAGMWKERGLGDISVLWNKRSGKGRILMRREQILKLCCNHFITAEMELNPHQGNDKFLTWHTFADFADEEPKFEQLAARFKTAEIAADFKKAFQECQANLGQIDSSVDPAAVSASEAVLKVELEDPEEEQPIEAKPGGFSAFLANQGDKWSCGTCCLQNDKAASKCIACETPNPAAPPEEKPAAPSFGVDATSAAPLFGVSAAPSFGVGATSGFTFGVGASSTPASSGFSFGAPAPGFSLGTQPAGPTPGFSFGAPAKPAAAVTPAFSFGSSTTSAAAPSFQFGTGRSPPQQQASPAKEDPKPSLFAGFSFNNTPVQTVGSPSSGEQPSLDYEKFVLDPSEGVLQKISEPGSVTSAVDTSTPATVATFLGRLSRVMDNKTLITTEGIVDDVLEVSFQQNSPSVLTNELLVTMGLIKSEEKDFKPESDVGNMLKLMAHAVAQPYFPQASAKTITAFVKKDKDILSNKIQDCADLFNSFQI